MRVNLKARADTAERRRDKTRARLIDAAMRVIAVKGPDAASFGDFALEAGVSRGVFYNYFPDQTELVLAVWTKVWEQIDLEIIEVTTGVEDPAEQIARACVRFLDEIGTDPVRAWIWLRLDATPALPPPQMVQHFTNFYIRGAAFGRFLPCDLSAALALTAGGMRMAARMLLTGATHRKAAYETIKLILIGLGVEASEAARLVPERPGPA